MIRVLVPCVIAPQNLQPALAAYRELATATRQEPGCVSYDLLQSADDPARFVLAEEWESPEHLDAHTRTEHFVRVVEELAGLEAAEPAEIYRKVV